MTDVINNISDFEKYLKNTKKIVEKVKIKYFANRLIRKS